MTQNGNSQQIEQSEAMLRQLQAGKHPSQTVQPATSGEAFTLFRLGEFLAAQGEEERALTREYAEQLLDMARRRLAYIEKIVGRSGK